MQLSLASLALAASFIDCASALGGLSGFRKAENVYGAHRERLAKRAAESRPVQSHATLEPRQISKYLNAATEKFVVNGSAIPDVPGDVGESYAGLLPISDDPNETRKLFFWFFPSTNPAATDEIGIWFNGGPGCSSLSGLLTENGPFMYQTGTLAPVINPYSWSNLTNMIWVEQPVGVGYSQGVPNIKNEVELAQQFIGFYKSFVDAFRVQNRKVYLTGESYAGYYVPYIADAFINANDNEYYNLAGVAINDPIIGDDTVQEEMTVLPFVEKWKELFYLNDTFMADLRTNASRCGYTDFVETYLKFPPPPGPFPYVNGSVEGCDLFTSTLEAVLEINPCFDLYHVSATCAFKYSHLGIVNPGDYEPPGGVVYFNRSDVQMAINAPPTNWSQCTPTNVFGGASDNQTIQDGSLGPALNGVLQHVMESINNTFIGSGELDMLLATNGTLLALQNMTWNGAQGFSTYYTDRFYVPYGPIIDQGSLAGAGYLGNWMSERGVTFYNVQLAGHELPGYAAGAGYRMLEALLGRIPTLASGGDYTTQMGNYTSDDQKGLGKRFSA